MYHGTTVPGFPQHPHRGFETITYVRQGLIDHSDSLGAKARFGRGDTQWMTAGAGVQHCEMFPLLDEEHPNPLELFQIWINLPAADKMVEPYFTMLWDHKTPKEITKDSEGRGIEITVVAGELAGHEPAAPPPDSWAAKPDADVAIWHIKLEANASWQLPPAASAETRRVLYAFDGSSVIIHAESSDGEGETLPSGNGAAIDAMQKLTLQGGSSGVECLLMQGRPIGEPVVQHGPFVMNTNEEIMQTMQDYRATEFGGWPWQGPDPTHGPTRGRFAQHVDGRVEEIGD